MFNLDRMLFLCMIPKSSSYPSRGFKKKKKISFLWYSFRNLCFCFLASLLSSPLSPFLSLQCIMMVNISWLFRRNPQARHSAVSNGSFCFQITGSGSAADLFTKTASPLTTCRGRSQEYDSGNDTSSPPSTQISSTRSRGQEKGSPSGGLSKSRDPNSGNTSDSGNSFTTSSPQNKGATLENLSPTSRGRESRSVHLDGKRGPD